MKEERLESCGLVFLYLTGRLEEGRGLSLRKIDSCQHLMDFSEQVRSLRAETAGKADMELFCILGRSGSVDRIVSAVGQQIGIVSAVIRAVLWRLGDFRVLGRPEPRRQQP